MSVKLIVTDLDNTLLRRDKTISDYTVSVFKRCREQGIFIIFATARPVRVTERFRAILHPNAIIADNGAMIVCEDEVISKTFIPANDANRLITVLIADKRTDCIGVECGVCQFTTYADRPPIADIDAWNFVYSDFSEKITLPVTKISIECANKGWVEGLLLDYPDLRLYSNIGENWRQITRRSATKRNALLSIAKRFNIAVTDIAAFGDDTNDIEMLNECGTGVAVENALDKVKAAADYICGDCDDDGIARWIEEKILA